MKACDNNMGLSTGLKTNTRVGPSQDKPFAVLADVQAVFLGKMEPRSHRDLPRNLNIPLREVRPVMNIFLGKLEKNSDAL